MVKVEEGTFTVDGQELFTKSWLPDGDVLAKLLVIHGFSDHMDNYCEFFPTLADRGIAVYGFDQRGWGHSVKKPADRGRSGPTATVIADIVAFIKPHLDTDAPSPPAFIFGHSMGGNEAVALMAAAPGSAVETDVVRKVRGWVLESPFFGWSPGDEPSALKITVGRIVSRLLPNFQLKHTIAPEILSHDPVVVERLRTDPLCHNTGTLEGLAALLDRVGDVIAGRMVPGPAVTSIWLGHGDQDHTAAFEASRTWLTTSAKDVPDTTFRAYPGWFHQLHGEPLPDRQLFYREVGDWILERVKAPEAAPAEAAPTETAPIDAAPAETAPVETASTEAKL